MKIGRTKYLKNPRQPLRSYVVAAQIPNKKAIPEFTN